MFSRGVGGAFFVLLWLGASAVATTPSGVLYLNGEPLSLASPSLQQGTTLLVPLVELATRLGLEVSNEQGRLVLRGNGFRQEVDASACSFQEGTTYVSLDWILALAGGETHRVGDNVYIECRGPTISDVEVTPTCVTIRFTGFCAHTVTVSDQGDSEVMLLRWTNCTLAIPAQRIQVGPSGVQEARLVESDNGVDLSIWIEAGTVLATEELDTGSTYVLTLRVAEAESQESILEVADGIKIHELSEDAGRVQVNYAYVPSWRNRYRLAPTTSSAGYESESSLLENLKDNRAVCSVPLGCGPESPLPDCLIMDGVPYEVPGAPTQVLAFDLFGHWALFSSGCSVSVKTGGRLVPVDGVNRPLRFGEIVSYAPGYTGMIARGIPGSFVALKIRDRRVVSVYQGPFVARDPSAILIVASGDATAALASVRLGDPVDLVCQFPQSEGTYRYAISSGPVLVQDGLITLAEDQREEISKNSGAVVLVWDWQGGLYLMTVAVQSSGASADETWNLIDILRGLPTAIKDAILVSSCARTALAYAGVSAPFQLGSRDSIQLALSLVPTTP